MTWRTARGMEAVALALVTVLAVALVASVRGDHQGFTRSVDLAIAVGVIGLGLVALVSRQQRLVLQGVQTLTVFPRCNAVVISAAQPLSPVQQEALVSQIERTTGLKAFVAPWGTTLQPATFEAEAQS